MHPLERFELSLPAITLDATYTLDEQPSGIARYCRRLSIGLATAHPARPFHFCYRPHRIRRAFSELLPSNVSRGALLPPLLPWNPALFHGLNQRLPKMRMKRCVCTFHDLFVLCGEYSSPDFRRRFGAQAREAAARADLIIAVSQFTADQVEHLLGVETARIRVIPHGVDLPPLGGQPREKILLCVGTIQKRKNTARLVRAYRRFLRECPGWRLVLAGSQEGYGAAEALTEIARLPEPQMVKLTGYIDEEELHRLYRRASILAFPSLDEGFGLPVLEAMAHGLPVVTSNRSALPEVAGDAALLVDPFDEEAIAETLIRLASDEHLRRELSQRGRMRAASFPWQRAVEATWEVYQELLG